MFVLSDFPQYFHVATCRGLGKALKHSGGKMFIDFYFSRNFSCPEQNLDGEQIGN